MRDRVWLKRPSSQNSGSDFQPAGKGWASQEIQNSWVGTHQVVPSLQLAPNCCSSCEQSAGNKEGHDEVDFQPEEENASAQGFDFTKVSVFPVQRQSIGGSAEDPPKPPTKTSHLTIQTKTAQEGNPHSSQVNKELGANLIHVPILPIQAKLTIGEPHDPYEQEADRVAAQVVSTPDSALQRQAKKEYLFPDAAIAENEKRAQLNIQAKGGGGFASTDFEQRLQSTKGSGAPLRDDVREFMEPRFGADFSQVRVHTGGEAVQLNKEVNAQAFTHGNDLYFNSGKYSPNSKVGKELLAHELTHTIQQTGGLHQKSAPSKNHSETAASSLTNDSGKLAKGFINPSFLWRAIQTKLDLNQSKIQSHVDPSTITTANATQSSHQVGLSESLPANQPEIQAKCSLCEQEDKIQRREISSTAAQDETLQAFGLDDITDAASGAADWVGDQASDAADWVGDRVDDVAEMGADAFAAIVEQVSPNLAALIRNGPEALLSENLEGGIQDWLGGILGDGDISSSISELQGSLGKVFTTLQGVINGDKASCEAFAEGIQSLRELAQSFMDSPAVQAIQDAFSAVGDAFQTVTNFIVAPVFDTLMEVAGGVFDQVKALASTIWEWGSAVREYLSDAWDWVLEQLGIGGDGEGGLLDWIKEKASAVWDQIKETFAPVIGPIQTVVSVMVAFSPVGPIIAAVTYGPKIVEAVQWLWSNKDNPDIVNAAHEQMGNTILPQLLSSAQGFSATLQSTATTLISQVVQMSESVLELLGAISGVPLLSIAQDMVQSISTGIQDFAVWCQESFQGAVDAVQNLFTTIQEVVAPYAEVLCSLAVAVVNPGMIPAILAGWAWRAIPDCYKPPIINFLLDAIIGILQVLPDLPLMGPLWPMLKSGILGFLEGVKGREDPEKIAITNKLAKIISGASPAFIFGFVKGLLKGIWEGITDPFVLMYSAIQGLGNLLQWLNSTANSAFEGDANSESEASSPVPDTNAAVETPSSNGVGTASTGSESSAVANAESMSPASAPSGTIPTSEQQAIGTRMREMGAELQPPVEQVTGGFMPAIEEAFSGGEGMGYEQLMQKFGEAWDSIQSAIQGAGQDLANRLCEFLLQDSAEGTMGEAVGWLTGTITFEIILGILTAATYQPVSAAGRLLKQFAKVLDWTGELMGAAFGALSRIGGYVMDAVRGLGRLLSNAGGAARAVMGALQEIGEKLMRFADELLGRMGRGAAGEASENAAERTAREIAETGAERTARDAAQEAAERTSREAAEVGSERGSREAVEEGAEEAAERGAREAVEESGERGARDTADDALKAAELPAAMAQARAITETNDAIDTPTPVLLGILNSTVKTRYSWLEYFEARPKGGQGRYSIHMIASDHEVDPDYTEDEESFLGAQGPFQVSDLEQRYKELLDNGKYSDYRELFDEINALPSGPEKARRALELESKLANLEEAQAFINRSLDDISLDDLSGGYHHYVKQDGTIVISRKSRDSGYPPLTIETVDGQQFIREGAARSSNRISKSGKLARNLGGAVPNHEAHHLLPDAVVRDHELTQIAMQRGQPPYDLDDASNGIFLPSNADGAAASPNLPLHRGSHPEWNRTAESQLNALRDDLLDEYGDLDSVPSDVLTQSIKEVENQLRSEISSLSKMK